MGSDGCRGGGNRFRALARAARIAGAAALAAATIAGCGLGPFAGSTGASDSSALASPGPAVTAELEPSPDASSLLSSSPDPNSAVGALIEGFPSDLLPVPAEAEVLVSSVEPIGDSGAYQVSLNLRTPIEAAAVVDVYRQSLTAAGFTEEQTSPDVALAAQSTFTRSSGDELLVIGVLDRDGVRTVTIGGRLRAGD